MECGHDPAVQYDRNLRPTAFVIPSIFPSFKTPEWWYSPFGSAVVNANRTAPQSVLIRASWTSARAS